MSSNRVVISEAKRVEMKTGNSREHLLRDLARSLLSATEFAGLFKHCLNCAHWRDAGANPQEQPEGCYKFMLLPPPRVIVAGCASHEDNVPF